LLKRDITYENPFTGGQVTETHYFHISKTDLVEMELEEHGNTYVKDGEELTGMQAKLQRIVDSEDGKAIMAEFKDIIRRAYGRKEGERFRKSQEIWDDFAASEAFSQLLWELCTQAEAGQPTSSTASCRPTSIRSPRKYASRRSALPRGARRRRLRRLPEATPPIPQPRRWRPQPRLRRLRLARASSAQVPHR
jgi:hypothetical protein